MTYMLGSVLLLASALFFSLYRLLIKATGDRVIFMAGLNAVSIIVGLVAVWFVPVIPARTFPLLLASSAFYSLAMIFLVRAFRIGDLGIVEPFKTGIRVFTVALLSIIVLEESAQYIHWIAVALLVLAFLFQVQRGGGSADPPVMAIYLAVIAGIASGVQYTFDVMGMRSVSNPLTYIVWNLFIGLPIVIYAIVVYEKENLGVLWSQLGRVFWGSILDMFGYALTLFVIYYLAVIDILPLLNLHVVFVGLLGWLVLREKMNWRKLVSSALILASATLMEIYT